MINKEIITNKLTHMRGYLDELHELLKTDSREIIENKLALHSVERLFQLVADTAVDINNHIIAESDYIAPEDHQGTFTVLGDHDVLPRAFAYRIAPSIGLRNQVVHKYGDVDEKRMIDDIKQNIGDYEEYISLVRKLVE